MYVVCGIISFRRRSKISVRVGVMLVMGINA